MKILYHHRTRAGDAQGIHIAEIVRAFRELGNEVEVVALAGEGRGRRRTTTPSRLSGLLGSLPAWIYEVLSLAYNVYGYLRLRRTAAAFRPELVYERYSLYTMCGIWAARRLKLPLILEVNAPLAQEQEKLGKLTFRRLARAAERWICTNSTKTIVVSAVLRDLLVAEGVPRQRMVVVCNGIDARTFHPRVPADAIRGRYRLEGKLVIGFVGWFRKWHGLELLLEAFQSAQLSARNGTLLLVGDGPARAELEQFVAEHNLRSHVIFTGPVAHADIPAHIAAMDIAVQPSAPAYACPMKIIEYMAMGKCIVAPDQPNVREVLEDGRDALLFTAGDRKGLEMALLRAIDDPVGRLILAKRAHELVQRKGLLWSVNAERALALVRETGASQ